MLQTIDPPVSRPKTSSGRPTPAAPPPNGRASRPIVIIGAGMAGMLAALFIKQRDPRANVLIIERSGEAGGHFRELDLPGFGHCDRAMRLLYETGIPEFDSILHGILPEHEWHILPDNVKDIVGIYWRGALQTHTAYLDLRRLEEAERRQCENEILQRARANGASMAGDQDAAGYLESRFGPTTAGMLTRVLEKFYRAPIAALHESATYQPVMNRVVLYDEDKMQPVLRDDALRAVIAWPDQLTFPIKRQPPQSGFYPRRFGMNGVIDAMVKQLLNRGVRLLFNQRVASLEISGEVITAVRMEDGSVIDDPALVISANGLQASAAMLRGPAGPPVAAPAPPRCWMVFFRAAERPAMDRLYHFWCFDEAYQTFRVTNYSNYCPDARTDAGYPFCLELWSEDKDPAQAIAHATRELRQMEILGANNRITASVAVPGPNMHALCTIENVRQLRAIRAEVNERSPDNMVTVGPFIDDGVMLLYEISRKMYSLIAERL
jgi:2-polyprenyl-6-methoxyphenol hydroxylase-like FAD-dependent oxidoreductase